MPGELQPRHERRPTLLTTASSELLIEKSLRTQSLLVIDYIVRLLEARYSAAPDVETLMALDVAHDKQANLFEAYVLRAEFLAPVSEEVAFTEEVNEALFKQYGEK